MSTSKSHLLSLPTEILQMIYLYSFSPHLPHASPLLGAVLSTPLIYRLTFFNVFWNRSPLQFVGMPYPPYLPCKPGPHLRTLFYPLPEPSSVFRPQEKNLPARIELQESVMRCRWCTFGNARRWLGEILLAIIKDLLSDFDIRPAPDTQTHLDSFMAKTSTSRVTFVSSVLDGSTLALNSSGPFNTALSANYRRPGLVFHMTLAPTTFLELPPHLLTGKPEWTMEKVDSLQLFSSYVSLGAIKCQREAFHEGMRNAVIQRHYDALLTLVWLGTRLAEYRAFRLAAADYDGNPLKPTPDLFRLVAKQGMRSFAAPSDRRSGYQVKNDEAEISLRLFTLLLRAHAESMPQNDPDIQSWASHLSTCRDSDGTVRALARWIANWRSSHGKLEARDIREPLFRAGRVSSERKGDKMAIRFKQILGGEVLGFEEQLEKRMRRRDGVKGDRGGLTLVV